MKVKSSITRIYKLERLVSRYREVSEGIPIVAYKLPLYIRTTLNILLILLFI